MAEYERVREETADRLARKLQEAYFVSPTGLDSIMQEWADQILSLDGIEIRATSQDLNESSHFIWSQTTQSKEEMRCYQTGEITKEEHERQRRQIFDEELAIYQKAQQDILKPDAEGKHWVRVIPKPKRK